MLKEKRKFLLALDGSDQSTAAVNYMAAMLPTRGTEIVLFNVLSQIPESFLGSDEKPRLRGLG